jgi:hypothetical protein
MASPFNKSEKNSKGDSKSGKKSSLGLTDRQPPMIEDKYTMEDVSFLLTYQFRLAIFVF